MPLVLVHNDVVVNPEHAWDDKEGVHYHYPAKYQSKIKSGEPFVYYHGIELSSHPSLVLTVTGFVAAFTTVETILSILGKSFNSPAPAPRIATSFTQQPQLISMISGLRLSAIAAAPPIDDSSPP